MNTLHRSIVSLLLVIASLGAGGDLKASTHTWIGGAGGVWSSAGNWSGGVPTSTESGGTIVEFGASSTSTMDIDGLVVDEIHFTGTGNTIAIGNGKTLNVTGATVSNNILDDVGGNTIAGPGTLNLTGPVSVFCKVTAGNLTLSCTISGTANVTFFGSGANGAVLTGNNSYTTTTRINSGTLQLNSAGVNTAIKGPVIIGSGGGNASALKLLQSAEIADTVSVTINSDGTFNTNGFSDTIGSLSVVDGALTQGVTGTLVVNNTMQMTGGSVTGSGTATLSLGGDVTATSGGSGAVVSSRISLNNATRTFTVNSGSSQPELTLTGLIQNGSTASGLIKAGAGNLLMSQATSNTYTGTTTVNDGLLTLNGGSSTVIPGALVVGDGTGVAGSAIVRLGQSSEIANTASVTVNSEGALDLNNFTEQFASLSVVDGSVTLGSGTLTLTADVSMTGGSISATSGTLQFSGSVIASSSASASASIACKIALQIATSIFQVSPGPVQPDLIVNGAVSEGAAGRGIQKTGTGTMRLMGSASNTFTGVTTVDKGVLQLNQSVGTTISGSSLVIGNAVDPAGSAVLQELQANDILQTIPVFVDASGKLDLNGFVDTVGDLSGTGSVTLPGASSLTVGNTNGTFTFGGSATGSGTFKKSGTGTMTLTGSCSTGTLTVANGIIQLNGSSASFAPVTLQVGDATGAASSAILRLMSASQLATTVATFVALDGQFDLNNFNQTLGGLTITSGQVAAGTGQLTLNGTLSMTGGSLGPATGTLVLGGNMVATSSGASGATISAGIALATSPTFTVNAGPSQPELTITGIVSETGGIRDLTKNGAGTLRFSSAQNTFTGTLAIDRGLAEFNASASTVAKGPLIIGNDIDAPGSATVKNLVSLNISSTSMVTIHKSGVLNLNGFTDRAGGLQGTGSIITGAAQLTVFAPGIDSEFDGDIAGAKITKSGTGTLTLGGAPTLAGTGTVTVNAGVFNVSGNRPDANVVMGAGTLSGTGTTGTITHGSATGLIDPGFPDIGTLSASGNVTFGLNAKLSIRLDDSVGQRVDKLNALSNLNVTNGTLALNVTGTPTRNAYVLASYGTLTGTLAAVTGLPSGYTLNYAFNDGTGDHNIAVTLPTVAFTGSASNVVKSTAQLNGSINPQGRTTSYYFEYGPTTLYGLKTASKGGLTGTTSLPVSLPVTGLNGGTTYHFRLVGVNSSGAYYGADATFTTPGPLVVTTAALPVSGLTATLNGTVNPQGLPATGYYEYGLDIAYGTKTPVLNFGNGMAAVGIPFALSGLTPGKTYHYRLVAQTTAGFTTGNDVTFTTKAVLGPVFLAGGQPTSLMKRTGDVATFTVMAVEGSPLPTDSPLTYQWNKNGAPIAGAKSASFTIGTVALTHAGTYTCLIKNKGGSLLSAPAELGVVDSTAKPLSVAQGSTAKMSVTAAGNGLSYVWQKDLASLGITGKTLSLSLVQSLDSGSYTCQVTGPGGSVNSGAITLSVVDGQPKILEPVTMPDGITGGLYSFQIPVDTASVRAPSSYTVTGLPAGVSCNPLTGLISGRITFVAPVANKSFPITIKATNAQGSTPVVNTTLLVHPFPTAGIGTYSGLVDRDPLPLGSSSINAGLGGFVSVTITGIGSYSGKFVLAGTSYPLTGNFSSTVGSTNLTTTTTFTRVGQSNLTVTFTTDSAAGTMSGSVSDALAGLSVAHNASRNPWTTAAPTGKSGTYTAELKIQNAGLVGNAAFPQGRGFATVTITPAGQITWVGKMADGAAPLVTFTTTLSTTETFPVHLMLNAGIGSAQGTLSVTPDAVVNINGGRPLLDGTLDWTKNAQLPSVSDRVYHDGFALFSLTVRGGKYATPAPGSPVLGLTPSSIPGTNNAHIAFSQGGITGPEAALVNRALRITPTNTADFSNPSSNPATLKLTLNAATGAISGSFILTDGGATRTVNYVGVLVPRTDVNSGSGYFLLPGLTPTATLSPILSGEVLLTP